MTLELFHSRLHFHSRFSPMIWKLELPNVKFDELSKKNS